MRVVVTGDILIEWRFARSVILHATGTPPETGFYMQATREESGAEALGKLIAATAKRMRLGAEVVHPNIGKAPIEPGGEPYWHAYMLCTPNPRPVLLEGKRVQDKGVVWRVLRRVGSDRQPPEGLRRLIGRNGDDADVVVVEDAYYGFSKREDVWPLALRQPREESWAVVHWRQPPEGKEKSAVWDYVARAFDERIVLVISADDLRVRRMRISRELTWERTIEDLDEGLRAIWHTELKGCKYLVVSFRGAGAAVIARTGPGSYRGHLYFDPLHLQETWSQDYPGSMFGYSRCLTTAVTIQLLRMLKSGTAGTDDPTFLGAGIVPGLRAQQQLHRGGFRDVPHRNSGAFLNAVPLLYFPTDEIADGLAGEFKKFRANAEPRYVDLEIPQHLDGKPADSDLDKWKILRRELSDEQTILLEAKRIVERGFDPGTTYRYPLAKFGSLVATDRTEIESFRSLSSLITNYMQVRNPAQPPQPLSIAVFGAPGSGKSFGITAVAKQVAAGHPPARTLTSAHSLPILTFNLSQFASSRSITDALHQVRDAALSGAVPLVFWDEFDTALEGISLAWLRYFLAPMQDGIFLEGPVTHNVGRAIFVFGGGTYGSMPEFIAAAKSESGRAVKASDFVSRLKGHVDVMGLNYPDGKVDSSIAMRRAILLHAFLKGSGGNLEQTVVRGDRLVELINVDPGIVYAFLKISAYNYAARSMESLVKMSAIAGKSMFERSSLVPSEQMRIHVEAKAFVQWVEDTPDWFINDSTTGRGSATA